MLKVDLAGREAGSAVGAGFSTDDYFLYWHFSLGEKPSLKT